MNSARSVIQRVLLLAAGLAVVGCGDDKGGVVEQVVDRFDTCNLLEPGVSRTDTLEELEMCLDGLVTSQRTDWTSAAKDCLKLSNCGNFATCYADVPDC